MGSLWPYVIAGILGATIVYLVIGAIVAVSLWA
jgi:hypothetical protein